MFLAWKLHWYGSGLAAKKEELDAKSIFFTTWKGFSVQNKSTAVVFNFSSVDFLSCCDSLSTFCNCFFNWHFPLQHILGLSMFSQRFLAITSWLIFQFITIPNFKKIEKLSKISNAMERSCFNPAKLQQNVEIVL